MRVGIYEFMNLAAGGRLETPVLGTIARNGSHVNRARFLILNQMFIFCASIKFTLATISSKSTAASDVYKSWFICQKPVCTVYVYWVFTSVHVVKTRCYTVILIVRTNFCLLD